MVILITGGLGFIGAHLCEYLLTRTDNTVICVDKMTYCANKAKLEEFQTYEKFQFFKADICDFHALEQIFLQVKPVKVVHMAAESHVDKSIANASHFIQSNINGTYTLLEVCRTYLGTLQEDKSKFLFYHLSTDEVFGALGDEGSFTEVSAYNPQSPYSASKASSDHLVRAWGNTFGIPFILSNCSNNYGPCQYPEKLIPVIIRNALRGKPIPIYGAGQNIRDWLYVEDHITAIISLLEAEKIGETYLIGGGSEVTNLEMAYKICEFLEQIEPCRDGQYKDLIHYVEDRPGHDYRYSVDTDKIRAEIGWAPSTPLDAGLRRTIKWYVNNKDFLFQGEPLEA